jgi:adenylate cyclase
MSESRRGNFAVLLLVALLAAGAGLVLKNKGPLRDLELSTVDARFDLRGKQQPRKDIVIVALDDKSLAADGGKYPINRTHWAKAIDQLAKAGAKTIAVDVQFTEPSGDDDADNALYESVSAAKPRVVLATTEVDEAGNTAILGGGPTTPWPRRCWPSAPGEWPGS